MHDYSRLRVWQDSRHLVTLIYELTADWPRQERFGLISQLRRAAVSVPSNIAEGAGRGTNADFARFVRHSIGSICELETLLWLAEDLGYGPADSYQTVRQDAHTIRRKLNRLELRLTGSRYAVE